MSRQTKSYLDRFKLYFIVVIFGHIILKLYILKYVLHITTSIEDFLSDQVQAECLPINNVSSFEAVYVCLCVCVPLDFYNLRHKKLYIIRKEAVRSLVDT